MSRTILPWLMDRNGDLNVLGPFVAFASPMDPVWIARNTPEGEKAPEYTSGQKRMLVGAFEKVLNKFEDEEVGVVIRLNDELYNKERFLERGFKHGGCMVKASLTTS